MAAQDETTEGPAPQDPLVGELVGGKYRVLAPLAKGGMARIYRAEQEPLKRVVALKALAPQDSGDVGARFEDRFYLEAATCARLKHPNTVTLFDYGHHAKTNTYYMIMELVEGRSLSRAIRDEGTFHPARAVAICIEICRSLHEAHQLGIVHRDLKPSNVMLVDTLEGEAVKVLDFGIAKVFQDDNQSITMDDRIVGSPRYMAPEQISQGEIDGRTDVYALGAILFELISGAPPYSGPTAIQTLMKHLNEPIPSLKALAPQVLVPDALEAFVASCLAKAPGDRPKSIDKARAELKAILPLVAEGKYDPTMSTESLVRHVAGVASPPRSETTQPTMDRPFEATLNRSAPLMLGGLTVVVTAAVVLTLGAVFLYGSFGRPAPPVEVPGTADVVVDVPAPAPDAPILMVGSEPEGAQVFEGDLLLGVTPLEVPIDPAQVGARRFELRLEGFQPYLLEQAAIQADGVVIPELVPAPKAAPKPRPAGPKPHNPDLEILDAR